MQIQTAWENEYREKKLLTLNDQPQACVLKFLRYLKKQHNFKLENKKILDLGSGTGRNGNYLADKGSLVYGLEISPTALKISLERAKEKNLSVNYQKGDIGAPYPYEKNFFDLILDITSSNSLNNKGREIYLQEINRVAKAEAFLLVRALCLDGDKNCKNLLKKFPGPEKNTYFMPQTKILEKVFTKNEILSFYNKYFKILEIKKHSGYTLINNQKYKRNFWLLWGCR